jgi:hypothetical protein
MTPVRLALIATAVAGLMAIAAPAFAEIGAGNSARDGDHCALAADGERRPGLELPADQFRGQ